MSLITTFLATLVALEFFYIFYLETVAKNSSTPYGLFKISQEELN